MMMRLTDCKFTNHTAVTTGGTIRSSTGEIHIYNSTMRGSVAKDGGAHSICGKHGYRKCGFVALVSTAIVDGETWFF